MTTVFQKLLAIVVGRIIDGIRYVRQLRMRFRVDLQNHGDIAGVKSLTPDRLDRFPLPASAGHFSSFRGKANFSRAFVTGNQLNRQFERGDQELCSIVCRISRRDTATLTGAWRF